MFQRTALRKFISTSFSVHHTRLAATTNPNAALHLNLYNSTLNGRNRNNLDNTSTSTITSTITSTRSFASLPKLIQQLRKATGAPMMECKKALDAEDNDYEKAADWLRKNGSAKAASKLAGREASEGMVGVAFASASDKASIVRVASETDFASRSQTFTTLVETVANACLSIDTTTNNNNNGSDLMATVTSAGEDGNGNSSKTVKDAMDDAILAIRENLSIASAETLVASSDQSVIAGYVHGKVFNQSNAGTAAAIVELVPSSSNKNKIKCTLSKDEIEAIGKKLAMHIVAAKPAYLVPEDVPVEEVEKEKEILMEQMAGSGKPAEILEKIVDGRMRKYYEGVCLAEQAHMLEEGNPKVSKALSQVGLELVAFKSSFIQ